MTHDELLATVQFNKQTLDSSDRNSDALRAVVELHKPNNTNEYCVGCGAHYYPCETIQAIEKELK